MKRAFIVFSATPTEVWLGRAHPVFGRALCLAACLISAASLMLALLAWATARERLADLEPRVAAARTASARDQMATLPRLPKIDARQREQLSEVVQQLNLPWADVLNALEQGTPAEVGLTLIEPDSKKARVRIQAEAKRVATLVAYADALSVQPPFSGVKLLRHETNEQDEGRPARLTFEVDLTERLSGPLIAQGAAR